MGIRIKSFRLKIFIVNPVAYTEGEVVPKVILSV
jgi:hypothetical protein